MSLPAAARARSCSHMSKDSFTCPSVAAYVFRVLGPWVQYVWLSGVDEELDVPVRWHLALHPRTSEQDSVIDG